MKRRDVEFNWEAVFFVGVVSVYECPYANKTAQSPVSAKENNIYLTKPKSARSNHSQTHCRVKWWDP